MPTHLIQNSAKLLQKKSHGKLTQNFEANLVKAGSVLPYLREGRVVWMWKPPEYWLTPEIADQFTDLVVADGHPPAGSSHDAPIGIVKSASLADPYVTGTISIFNPHALSRIADGLVELSQECKAKIEAVGREIGGVWCDFAQTYPELDHMGLVQYGRGGSEVALKRVSDGLVDSSCLELSVEDARGIIRLDPYVEKGGTIAMEDDETTTTPEAVTSETAVGTEASTPETPEVAVEAVEAPVEPSPMVAEFGVMMRDTMASMATQITESITAALNPILELLSAEDAPEATVSDDLGLGELSSTDSVATAAKNAIALFAATQLAGITSTIEDCVSNPTAVYRQVQELLAPDQEISDEMLPVFCSGLIAGMGREQSAVTQPEPVEAPVTVSDAAAPAVAKVAIAASTSATTPRSRVHPLAGLAHADRVFVSPK